MLFDSDSVNDSIGRCTEGVKSHMNEAKIKIGHVRLGGRLSFYLRFVGAIYKPVRLGNKLGTGHLAEPALGQKLQLLHPTK